MTTHHSAAEQLPKSTNEVQNTVSNTDITPTTRPQSSAIAHHDTAPVSSVQDVLPTKLDHILTKDILEVFPKPFISLIEEMYPKAFEDTPYMPDVLRAQAALLSLLVAVQTMIPNLQVVDHSDTYKYCNHFLAIFGQSGSGKGKLLKVCDMVQDYHQKCYDAMTTKYRQELELYNAYCKKERKESQKTKQATKDETQGSQPVEAVIKPIKPQPTMFTADITGAALGIAISQANKEGYMSFMLDSEGTALKSSQKGQYSNQISELIRKGHANERAVSIRSSDDTAGYANQTTNFSIALTTQPGAFKFSSDERTNGTAARMECLYVMEDTTEDKPVFHTQTINSTVNDRFSKHYNYFASLAYKGTYTVLFTANQQNMIHDWCKHEDRLPSTHIYRLALSARRYAALLWFLYLKSEKSIGINSECEDDRFVNAALRIADVIAEHTFFIFGNAEQQTYQLNGSAIAKRLQLRDIIQQHFPASTFCRKDLMKVLDSQYKGFGKPDRTLHDLVKNGTLVKKGEKPNTMYQLAIPTAA